MPRYSYSSSYSPVGDLVVVSICLVMFILMLFSYNRRTRSFRIFLSTVATLVVACYADVVFNLLGTMGEERLLPVVKLFRCVYHASLFTIFFLFVLYIGDVTQLNQKRRVRNTLIAGLILLVVVGVDVYDTVRGTSVVMGDDRLSFQSRGVFFYGYVAYVALILVLMTAVRKRLYRRVMLGFYGTMAMSFVVLLVQGVHGQSSFTAATFLYPMIGMFYIMHASPYDAAIGAIDSRGLEDTVKYNLENRKEFGFLSLYMHAFDEEGKSLPTHLQATIRRFATDFFRGAMLFQVGKGHWMLIYPIARNRNHEKRTKAMLDAFQAEYRLFQYDYKIVVGKSIDEVSRRNEYASFIRDIHRIIPENSIYTVGPEDVKRFNSNEYVLHELEDIYKKRDLNDPRVLVYCQPVLNIRTGRYDTAEALMRLKLERTGMVFPDRFIPLAEEYGYIHVLTEIILNKTCRQVGRLMEQHYAVTRVSVNVSVLELKLDRFCEDITRVIKRNGIPGDKIAIELTESMTDSDFILMKDKISQLREQGIKFYLDDFGTGYSNLERIMGLPFDIIKFDRSLVVACGASERSQRIVHGLANMLAQLDYAVLFEGVETADDEAMCEDMSASYLQGYKYSKPVPIEKLAGYFEKEAA